MQSIFKRHSQPILNEPYLLCGLPDLGFVGKQVVDYLKEKSDAQLFEEVYSPYFPAHVLIKKDGTVELMKNEFYYSKQFEPKKDAIFLTGNTQAITPEGQYELADETLKRMKKLNVKKFFTISPHIITDRLQNENPNVYAVVNNSDLIDMLKKLDIPLLEKGSIRGFNGLLLGIAKLKKIDGICLVTDTIDYMTISGRILVDVKAARATLEVLCKILEIKVDMADLDKQAKATEEFIQKLEEVERQALEEITKSVPPRKQSYYI